MSFPYIPRGLNEESEMLGAIGAKSFEDLLVAVPQKYLLKERLNLPKPKSEIEIVRHFSSLANANTAGGSSRVFLGAGSYDHYVPAIVDHISFRSEFYTAYTPYQAEVGQGTLTAIFEFQTLMAELTGMDLANASMYDGASALAEAVLLALSKNKRSRVLVAGACHPNYLRVLTTYVQGLDIEVLVDPTPDGIIDRAWVESNLDDTIGAVVTQTPSFLGLVEDATWLFTEAKALGAIPISVFQPHALALYKTPGEMGADLAVGEGQSLGTSPSFGGPSLGLFAVSQEFVRLIPGRLIGETEDKNGKRCFVMTLRTREQDIRRAKATSNICTNQSLLALRATIYASLLGPRGLAEVAESCLERAHYTQARLQEVGYDLVYEQPFFQEFVVRCPRPAREVVELAHERGLIAGLDLGQYQEEWKNHLMVCCSEKHSKDDLDNLVSVLGALAGEVANV